MDTLIDIEIIKYIVLFTFLVAMCFMDLKSNSISNGVMLLALSISVGLSLFNGLDGITLMLSGLLVGFLLFIPPFAFGHVGGADVKAFAIIGSYIGVNLIISAFLFTLIAGGLYSLIFKFLLPGHTKSFQPSFQNCDQNKSTECTAKQSVPYLPAITIGVIASLLIPLRWSI